MNSPSVKMPGLWSVVVATAFFAVGCGDKGTQAAWWQKENERIALNQELELKKFRLDQVQTGDVEVLRKVNFQNQEMAARVTALATAKGQLQADLDTLESEWALYRIELLEEKRRLMTGKTFDKLSIASGREFHNVKVAAVHDGGVTIRHSDGSATLRFKDLTADQRASFGLDADLALAAEQTERENAVAYERWIEQEMVSVRAEEEQERRIAASEKAVSDRQAKSERQQAAAQHLIASNSRALGQPAKRFGSGSSYSGYSRPRYYSSYYHVYRPYYRAYVTYPRAGDRRVREINFTTSRCYTPSRVITYKPSTVSSRKTSFAETRLKNIP